MSDDDPSDNGQSEAGRLLSRLSDFFEMTGVPVPADLDVRTVYIGLSIHEQAVQIAGMLRGKNRLFRRGPDVGTIHPESGDWEHMDPDRFASWLPLVAGIHPYSGVDKEGKPKSCSFKAEDTRRVLRSDELRNSLPEIAQINQVRLPVFRDEIDERGKRKIEFLPYGYDQATKTFTVRGVDYDPTGVDPETSAEYLVHLLKYFPMDERSRSVQIAAMLTVFCHGMFIGRSPLFLWNSNLPGSGKSRLAQLAVLPHGEASKAGFHWRDANETRKELDSTAAEHGAYILFDDVSLPKGTKLRSTDLNRWLTGKIWEARLMHTQTKLKVRVRAATFMTGTQLQLDDHLGRRTLLIDLQAKQRARDRVLPDDAILLDDDFFEDDRIVRKVLEGLAGLVRWWDEHGRPDGKSKPLESFEGWSKVIPAIVGVSFHDCLEMPESLDSGDVDSREFEILIQALIREHVAAGDQSGWVSMTDIIRTARLEGLFPSILMEIDQIVRELSHKRGHEWADSYSILQNCPSFLIDVPVEKWTEAQRDDYAFPAEPTEEQKRWQAAAWTDRSIETKWGNHFSQYAVLGQWFKSDAGDFWTLERKKRKQGTGYLLKRVDASENNE